MDLVASVRKEGSRYVPGYERSHPLFCILIYPYSGGRADFKWSEVQTDQHRENYLGHSLMARTSFTHAAHLSF